MSKLSSKYQKIMSVYERDEQTKKFLVGRYSTPEIAMLKDVRWAFTEKVDGTNIRVIYENGEVSFAGRSDDASIPRPIETKLDTLFKTFEQRAKLKEVFPDGAVLYGEGFGGNIQKAGPQYGDFDFVLFDVRVGDWQLERESVEDVGVKLGLKVAPIIGYGTLDEAIALVKKGFPSVFGQAQSEGIVARPVVELFTRKGDRVITKVKCRDFLP